MKISRYEPMIILLVVLIAAFLNISAFLYRSFVTPPGQVFAGTHLYSDDYAVYVSYIKQGQQGRWTVIDKYTSEPHQASLIHLEYLLLGKLTGLFRLSPVLSYHFSRLFFSLVFLLAIYGLLLRFFPKKSESILRVAAFILAAFSNSILTRVGSDWQIRLGWLVEIDPTQRFGTVLHYQLGFISLLGIFISLYSILLIKKNQASKKHWLLLFAFGLMGGFVLPASLIVALTTLVIFSFLTCLRLLIEKEGRLFSELKSLFLATFLLLLSNLPALFYYQQIFKTLPWSHIIAWERTNRSWVPPQCYLSALGPISLLAPLCLLAFKQRKGLIIFLFSWLAAVIILVAFVADLVGLNPTRFFQNPAYIPLAILTVLGIDGLIGLLAKKFSAKAREAGLLLMVGLIILLGVPTSLISLRNQFEMYADFSSLMYPEGYYLKAFKFLEVKTNPDDVVLSLYQAGNLIPFLAGNTVFLGHLQETLNYREKVKQAEAFYSGGLSASQAKEFLKEGRVKLIFHGPQEKFYWARIEEYSFLEPIFSSPEVTIFKFKND